MHNFDPRRCAACVPPYVWEFLLTRRSPLEPVTPVEAHGYRRNWAFGALAMLAATGPIAFAATQI
jgi:hypothetical protein